MFRKNLGIDVGSTQISICSAEDGLLLKEPSVAAVDIDTGEVVEAGNAAIRAVQARPDRYRRVEPLWDDLLKNAKEAEDADGLKSALSAVQMKVVEDLPVLGLFFRTGTLISKVSLGGLTGIRETHYLRGLEFCQAD